MIWHPFTSVHSLHLKKDVIFQRQCNPKLVPADSWYMKYQTSLQLVTEPLATLPKLPKLPAVVSSWLAQPTDPKWPWSWLTARQHSWQRSFQCYFQGCAYTESTQWGSPGPSGWYHSGTHTTLGPIVFFRCPQQHQVRSSSLRAVEAVWFL